MRWFLITLAIGLAASDKLDRTYLPPPSAQHAGGNLGDRDAPLKPPNHKHSGPEHNVVGQEGSQNNFGFNGEPVNFGDKIPKVPFNYYPENVPTTTTSIAFSQTTTYPPTESYETTALPINPVTGLPVQLHQGYYPYGTPQGQQSLQNQPSYTQNQDQSAPTYGTNLQPGFVTQSPSSAPVTFGTPGYEQSVNQPGQDAGQNVITPGSPGAQIPGSVYQLPGQSQGQNLSPGDQENIAQQIISPYNGAPGSQNFNQYPGQNEVAPGDTIQIPGGLIQYPSGKPTAQQGFVPSTVSPINLQPSNNQYGLNYDGSQAPVSQGTYTGLPINVQDQVNPQMNQGSYQSQQPFNVGNIQPQYPSGNQNLVASGPSGLDNAYQPVSTSSAVPSSYYNGASSTKPNSGFPSSTSAYSTVRQVYRPERPQAAADRNAVIINYENIRTPNGYSYSFDTSNGIHADESGIIDNGTKAQGAYSYTGDDGKIYSVIYTADENGFQPRGDHLPTPPPIPEAIQRVIEQAARDKAAGIFDDGSYDETKYGSKKYQGKHNRRRPQNQNKDGINNKQFYGGLDDQIKPIAGIIDAEYDEGSPQDQITNMFSGTRTRPGGILSSKRPSNQMKGENNAQNTSEVNRRISNGDFIPLEDVNENGKPIVEDGTKELVTKDQDYSQKLPHANGNGNNVPETEEAIQRNKYGSKFRRPTGQRPSLNRVKNVKNKYPGSQTSDAGHADYPETGEDGFNTSPNRGNLSIDGSGENIDTNFDRLGSPIADNRKQTSRQRFQGNGRPGTSNTYSQNQKGTPQGGSFSQAGKEPLISNYVNNAANQPSLTQQDETGYFYQQPNTNFEQNQFPSRFRPQGVSSTTQPDQSRTEFVKGTTLKPFVTPNVYNQNDQTRQSTTRRPFTTVGVTSPTENSYTDYDDGDDYETDQDNNDDRIDSTRRPDGKTGTTSRPYQSTTSRPQFFTQKGTPGDRIENSRTVTPEYGYSSTSPMPSHNSRFGNTESPQNMKPFQSRLSSFGTSTAVGRPVTSPTPSGTRTTHYNYQTERPTSKYSDSNIVSGYPTTGVVPGSNSYSSTPESYYTSTYGPSMVFSSTTTVPSPSGYRQDFDSQNPSGAPGASQSSPTGTFHTGYHYGPPKSDYSGISGVSPTSPPGTYFQSTTPGRPGSFIQSQPGYTVPQSSPFGTYQGNLQNGPSKPDFSTTIVSSIPGGTPVFGYPGPNGPKNPQSTAGYEYGSSRPTYSTEPSFVGTTPGSFMPSGTVAPTQGYPTSYGSSFPTTKDAFATGPVVDGFGRPINIGRGDSHTGVPHQAQSTPRPSDNLGSNFGGTEQYTTYPGSYDQTKITGEDFSGPKQPQRYDSKTGYHYK